MSDFAINNDIIGNELKEKLEQIEELEKRILFLENIIENTKVKLNEYRWMEIREYFDEHGIVKTAAQFDMTIEYVMYFIVKCDDCEDGLQNAPDFRECYIQLHGEDPYEEMDEEENGGDNSLFRN